MAAWRIVRDGSIRRYLHATGTMIIVHGRSDRVSACPAWCRHVSKTLTRQEAAAALREGRSLV